MGQLGSPLEKNSAVSGEKEKITFYYNPLSRGRIVHWMLEEVEADYQIHPMKWETGEHKSPEYLKINPMGKIPAITHRSVVVTETAAICAYLADAFPEKGLAPKLDDPMRGPYYRWLFFAASCLEPVFLDRKYPRTGDPMARQLGHGNYGDTIGALERAIAGGFVLGDRFSAADVYLSSQIGWGILTKDMESTPTFQRYLEKCMARPAFRRFTEMAGPIPGASN